MSPKPIYLLADSQLLFETERDTSIPRIIRTLLETDTPTAAYIGAANGDEAAFYAIFEAAMQHTETFRCRMIGARFDAADVAFLASADVILLAGGDPIRGWRAMEEHGIQRLLRQRYEAGAVIVGVSAGAVLLGQHAWGDATQPILFDALGLVPWIVDAHDDASGWARLRSALALAGPRIKGLGLPAGSGFVSYPDQTVEPIRRAVIELVSSGGDETVLHLLLPRGNDPAGGARAPSTHVAPA